MLEISSPALTFPAISLILLAYTSRFLSVANLIRSLYGRYNENPNENLLRQIKNLRRRIYLIRDMQILGVGSIFLAILTMALIYEGFQKLASWSYAGSLITLLVSLGYSVYEITISTQALDLQLSNMLKKPKHLKQEQE